MANWPIPNLLTCCHSNSVYIVLGLLSTAPLRVVRRSVFVSPNNSGKSISLRDIVNNLALGVHLTRQLEEIEKLGDDYQDQGLIFPGDADNPCGPWTLTRKFERILKRAGLPRIRFHDLRHTCATLMLCEGVHIKIVQELLGHAGIPITLNTYSHVLPGMGGEAAGAMDRIFG